MLRESRYDVVIHIVTAADGAEKYYNLDNKARHENIEQAIIADRKILSAYIDHPNHFIIDNNNSKDFKHKKQRTYNQLLNKISNFKYQIKKEKV